jgi:hypothetical protein
MSSPAITPSSANNLWEHLVLTSPRSTNRITHRYDVPSPELCFDWRDKRGSAHVELTRTRRTDAAAANSLPNETPSVMAADRQETAFWPEVIRYFMEGFALYGASVHPTGCFPDILRSNEKKTLQTGNFVLREHGYLFLVSPIAMDITQEVFAFTMMPSRLRLRLRAMA